MNEEENLTKKRSGDELAKIIVDSTSLEEFEKAFKELLKQVDC